MKKYWILLFIAFMLFPFSFLCAQQANEKVAIYTTDESGMGYAGFVGDFLTNAIVKQGRYEAYERTSAFLAELNKEQTFQRTGAVDDSQISSLGKMFGVQLVCVAKIGKLGSDLYISARLVNVETSRLNTSSRPVRFGADDLEEMESACLEVVKSLFMDRDYQAGTPVSGNSSSSSRRHPGEPEMVFVQGGTFLMGCTAEQGGDCDSDESPNHLVTVSDFYIGKYEVTQAQWEAVMGTSISQQRDKAGGSSLYGVGANYPMYYVSWHEVQEFINRLNALTGKQYRLPTEAEWEYAARGGNQSRGYKYSGSNFIEQVAWFTDNSGRTNHPVGTKSPNELGIYDMSGNVWEWCYDWYGSYSSTQQTNPMGPSSGSYRVYRGGGRYNSASFCRVSNRLRSTPTDRNNSLGFRLVLSH